MYIKGTGLCVPSLPTRETAFAYPLSVGYKCYLIIHHMF